MDDFRKKLLLKTGCLISADGSNDAKIAPEDLQNYQVPPPHQYLEPAVELPESNQVEFEEPPLSDTMVVDENNFLTDDQELHERIDREDDCIVDSFIGWKIKALYENGWFVGKISYYNKLHEEYYVLCEDDKDYISLDDIDGVEVQLL